MNKFENAGILNWRGWPFVRKAQVVGAAAGALVTMSMPLVVNAYDGGALAFPLLWLEWAIFSPAAVICRLFGWEWKGSSGPSLVQTTLAALTNAFLLCFVGTLLGWIVGKLTKPQRKIYTFE